MNSLLKSVKSMTNKRNFLVKESLRRQLNTTVMEMQNVEGIGDDIRIGNCEETMALCSVLEAIFLHGLKDSLLNRVTEALSGPDFDAMPQPSFWGPLLVFSHREIIDQIQGLKQITTEVGYCRAWIRLALNEGLLSSYLLSIQRDNSALKPYYDRAAFIRDTDNLEVARRLIESLDNIPLNLACNTSLLNFWSSTPLLMAAIWSPPMKSCPIVSAVDIAKTINTDIMESYNFDDVETASSIGSMSSFSSQSIFGTISHFNENDALKMILGNDSRDDFHPKDKEESNTSQEATTSSDKMIKSLGESVTNTEKAKDQSGISDESAENFKEKLKCDDNSIEEPTDNIKDNIEEHIDNVKVESSGNTVGNSLLGKFGWSTSLEESESLMTSSVISRESEEAGIRTPGEGSTYDALIKSYHTGYATTSSDLRDFLDKYPSGKKTLLQQEEPKFENKIINNFDEQILRLPREIGLDDQNYSCFDCDHAIGMTFGKAHVCSFTGNYYCNECMSSEEFLIPSKIIHNWDLKHYPVSIKAAHYLTDCSTLLDLKVLNPRIYTAVDLMAQLHSLRVQLNLLRAYLFTCREPIIESLQKKVRPREYLYEHVHKYSVSDLLDVPSGTLALQLQKIIDFARNHVLNCWLCSQKGFICEICNNPKVIYPFDMASTYRCSECNAVFHIDCLNATKPCPKCERKRKRLDRRHADAQEIITLT